MTYEPKLVTDTVTVPSVATLSKEMLQVVPDPDTVEPFVVEPVPFSTAILSAVKPVIAALNTRLILVEVVTPRAPSAVALTQVTGVGADAL
jgi:hypothetical protein